MNLYPTPRTRQHGEVIAALLGELSRESPNKFRVSSDFRVLANSYGNHIRTLMDRMTKVQRARLEDIVGRLA